MTKPNLGTYGAFGHYSCGSSFLLSNCGTSRPSGYGAIWAGGSPPAELSWVDPILEQTDKLQLATGIVNIWTRGSRTRRRIVPPDRQGLSGPLPARHRRRPSRGQPGVPQADRRAQRVSRQARRERGARRTGRVVAALGPKVLKLSADRSAGAHPYLTTPEHSAEARKVIGPSAFLAPEHKVVLTTDAEKARATGRKALEIYLQPRQLPQQLEAARLHRRGRGEAGQRPPGRRRRRVRHPRCDRRAAEGTPRRRAPTTWPCRC